MKNISIPLPGLEDYNPLANVPYYEVNPHSLSNIEWSQKMYMDCKYAHARIKEVAEKHSNLSNDYPFIKRDYRSLSQILFDLPIKFTNRASRSVINDFGINEIRNSFIGNSCEYNLKKFRKKHGKVITFDHEWPRQQTADILIQQYQNSPFSFEYFHEQWENKYSFVNLVTTEENSALSTYTKANEFTDPKTLYQNSLVVLESLLPNREIVKSNFAKYK